MNSVKRLFLTVVGIQLSAGCMSTVQRQDGKVFAPRPASHSVILVETSAELPSERGPWVKIGEATVTDNGWGADVTKLLIERARRMGGDALVRIQKHKTTQSLGIGWKDFATAEVWRDAK